MSCNKLTDRKEIERLAHQKFDSSYSIDDILNGDTVTMMADCTKWVVENYHREALLSYLIMEGIAIEGRAEIEDLVASATDHVYSDYDELTACMELERLLT